ncbi:MAG: helix-hairpin-helix domain-containing protein [Myxococcales bacterium]|nr:helix-hairpin-helix domain-containing protein [Myxococcales bacterium]
MKQKPYHLPLLLSLALSAPACLQAPPESEEASDHAEDAADDKAALGFGVEADAPDALAVLKIANTFSVTKLVAAGLTKNVAKRIVKARTEQGDFATLVALDKVPYVGIKVFSALRWHATIKKLYPTSLRVPLVTAYGESLPAMLNEALVEAGQAPLPDHVWINDDYAYGELRTDLRQRFAEAGLPEDFEPLAYATVGEFDANAETAQLATTCWIGNPWHVADVLSYQIDDMLSDQYTIWGWRVGDKTVLNEDLPPDTLEGEDTWNNYDTNSNEVLLLQTTYHDGPDYDVVPACRNPR